MKNNPDHKKQVLARMQAAIPSSLSGQEKKVAAAGSLEARMAAESREAAAATVELLQLVSKYRIEPWETQDGMRAGLHAPELVKKTNWQAFARASQLFFGVHHVAICRVLKKELVSAGRLYGMQPDNFLPDRKEMEQVA